MPIYPKAPIAPSRHIPGRQLLPAKGNIDGPEASSIKNNQLLHLFAHAASDSACQRNLDKVEGSPQRGSPRFPSRVTRISQITPPLQA